jgi:hypothetical protein
VHVVLEGLDVNVLYDVGECENIGVEEERGLLAGLELYVELEGALYGGRDSEVATPLSSVEEKAGFPVGPGLCV